MGYVVAAYVVTVGGLAAYGWALARERRRLRDELEELSRGGTPNPG